MKRNLWILLSSIFITACSMIYAQKIEKLELNSNGSIMMSQPTDTSATYIITVEGVYSMWPRSGTQDCYGVDAVYVYDVPKAEVDALRWLPEYIEVAGQKIPIMPLPQYVGDPKEFQIPPEQLGSPFFELSFRKYIGFRIDGEPIPNIGFNNLTHTYTIEKKGTGLPFKFQILDTNYSIIYEKTIPRYDDNCGNLKITVEEKKQDGIELCDLGAICEDSLIVGIRVSSRIFVEDTNSITGKRNLLKFIDKSQIGLVENGKFKCDIDTILCQNNQGLALGFIIDQSGSMRGPISDNDPNERMTSSKTAFKLLANNLNEKDSVFIMGFENKINLLSEWKNDKNEIIKTIDEINYVKNAQTSFYEGIIQGLDKISLSNNPNRYLIVISDGGNTLINGQTVDYDKIPDSLYKVIANKSVNIPIYIVALGFTVQGETGKYIDSVGRNDIKAISNVSKGKDIDVYSSTKLDSVMKNLKLDINASDCCEIRFDIDKCKKGETKTIRLIYAPNDSTILTKAIKFNCDCEENGGISYVEEDDVNPIERIEIFPNPSNSISTIQYNLPKSGMVKIRVMDLLGNLIQEYSQYQDLPGIFNYNFETAKLVDGSYFVQIEFENKIITSKLIVIK